VSLKKFTKDPNAILDYTIDWSAWLDGSDTISAATSTPTAGIVVDSTSHTATQTTVWLSGGTAGTSYDVTVHITTAGGRQDDRTITIVCKQL
jgi:hypothetical protein